MVGIGAVNFNWVGRELGVQSKGTVQVVRDELGIDAPLREDPGELSENTLIM